MTTDSKKSVAPASLRQTAQNDVDRLLQTGLADFSLRQLLGLLISSAGAAERNVYLQDVATDKANGFYERALQVGSIPVDIEVPRTHNGDFRPASIPAPYRRGYPAEVQSLLLGLLGSSRSINAAKDALQKMGLSRSEQDLERIAAGLIDELELRNNRPIHPDMLAVFMDGKYIELRDGDKLRSACIYVLVGLGCDGKKQILSCVVRPGRENLEDWKLVLRGAIERGLRRVLIIIHDDFSGLLRLPRVYSPTPMSSFVSFICSATLKPTSRRPTRSSFNNVGVELRRAGIWSWQTINSRNCAIALPNPIRPGWQNYEKNANIISHSSSTRSTCESPSRRPMSWKPSTASSRSCAAIAAAISIPPIL